MKVFILTGAGISAESGVKTFRDFENGLWNDHKIEDVCQKDCFEKNPSENFNMKLIGNATLKTKELFELLEKLNE